MLSCEITCKEVTDRSNLRKWAIRSLKNSIFWFFSCQCHKSRCNTTPINYHISKVFPRLEDTTVYSPLVQNENESVHKHCNWIATMFLGEALSWGSVGQKFRVECQIWFINTVGIQFQVLNHRIYVDNSNILSDFLPWRQTHSEEEYLK